jgi:HK97 family phage portal protein
MFWKNKDLEKELQAVKEELNSIKNAEFSIRDSQSFYDYIYGGLSQRTIGPDSAMRCSAVFACVRLIAGAVASAPVKIYRKLPGGQRTPEYKHPYLRLLTQRPNEYMTASTFWKTMAEQKVLMGNAYAVITRTDSGRPVAITPVRANRVEVFQAWERGLEKTKGGSRFDLYYSVAFDDGSVRILDSEDVLHIPNVGWDGKKGLSTIKAGAQAMGLALSAEESAARLFDNGMISQLALTYPTKLTPDAQQALRDSLANKYSGTVNHHKPLILTEGGDVKTVSMSAEDAQLLEARQFSVIDIARFFGVPPVMIGESDKTSSWGSGVEQMARWFVMFTLNDHLTDIEQELAVKLFKNSEYLAEFDEAELTRGDTKTRGEFYRMARGSLQEPGIMTINEIREAEGLPPVPEGNKIYTPVQEQQDDKKQADESVSSERTGGKAENGDEG